MPPLTHKVRNVNYIPYLEKEGTFLCPMPKPPPVEPGEIWHTNLKPYERLYYHQTLNSVRSSKRYIGNPAIPRDSLDFQLQSRYNHSKEVFPDKVDQVFQKESCALDPQDTFRVLGNDITVITSEAEVLGHPLRIGGIQEKISPDSVKLINSGPHTQLVNNGYSRQPKDGNFFRY